MAEVSWMMWLSKNKCWGFGTGYVYDFIKKNSVILCLIVFSEKVIFGLIRSSLLLAVALEEIWRKCLLMHVQAFFFYFLFFVRDLSLLSSMCFPIQNKKRKTEAWCACICNKSLASMFALILFFIYFSKFRDNIEVICERFFFVNIFISFFWWWKTCISDFLCFKPQRCCHTTTPIHAKWCLNRSTPSYFCFSFSIEFHFVCSIHTFLCVSLNVNMCESMYIHCSIYHYFFFFGSLYFPSFLVFFSLFFSFLFIIPRRFKSVRESNGTVRRGAEMSEKQACTHAASRPHTHAGHRARTAAPPTFLCLEIYGNEYTKKKTFNLVYLFFYSHCEIEATDKRFYKIRKSLLKILYDPMVWDGVVGGVLEVVDGGKWKCGVINSKKQMCPNIENLKRSDIKKNCFYHVDLTPMSHILLQDSLTHPCFHWFLVWSVHFLFLKKKGEGGERCKWFHSFSPLCKNTLFTFTRAHHVGDLVPPVKERRGK